MAQPLLSEATLFFKQASKQAKLFLYIIIKKILLVEVESSFFLLYRFTFFSDIHKELF